MILQFLAYLKLPEIVILANEYSNQKGTNLQQLTT